MISRLRRTELKSAFRAVRARIWKKRLDTAQSRVRDTEPLTMRYARLCFISMVSHRDVNSYLCAIKSLYSSFNEGKIIVIDDGSLTRVDRTLIVHHVPKSEFVSIDSIDVGACPRGGCWERLVHILRMTSDSYVIQVDSDTLAVGVTSDVVDAYKSNYSFMLPTDLGQSFGPVEDTAALVAGFKTGRDKIGCVAEMTLPSLPHASTLLYARGSAGFAGFAKGSFVLSDLEALSVSMQKLLGDRWTEWGSEQVASNFMIANAKDAVVLPYAAYSCFEPWIDLSTRVFLHFYGTYRFHRGYYRKRVISFIKQYRADATNLEMPAQP